MEVNVEDKSAVKKVLHCEVPKEDVEKELDKAYRELKKTAEVKGFRKGKVPRKVLENRFSKDVHADIAPRLIQESFSKAVEEHDLKVVGSPQLDPPDLDPDGAYKFDITVEVKPALADIDFEGMELEKPVYEVSEEEVDSQIYMIRKTMASKKRVEEERPVKEDDFVLIDYQGFVDGEPFDKAPLIENYVMAIGNDTMPEAFSRKLTGVIPHQELDIDVAYPEDDSDPDFAGKTVTYKVTLKEIQEEVLPEADDELVKELGQFETLEDVKAAIRENLSQGYEQRVQQELSEQIFQNLLKRYEFEVPEAMIEGELENIVTETEQAYAQNNTSLEDAGLSREMLRERYRDVAEKQVRRHLLLDRIITQEALDLTDEEREESYRKMARDMNASEDVVRNYFENNRDQFENFKYIQLEKKAVNLIIEKGNITYTYPEAENTEETGEETGVESGGTDNAEQTGSDGKEEALSAKEDAGGTDASGETDKQE